MKTLTSWILIILIFAGLGLWFKPTLFASLALKRNEYELVKTAWVNEQSNLVVEVEGRVIMELPDIEDGTTYQQFLISLENNHNVLVSHDIGISKPLSIAAGSVVHVRGEYDWTPHGGMIHWTHRDPSGVREGGWIESNGKRYD